MKILITGGAGYIGSRLGCRLAGDHEVVLLDNLRRGTRAAAQGLVLVEGDVRDAGLLREVSQDCEVVFHLAAESAVMSAAADPEYCFETNVAGTFRVLRAAQAAGVKRVVFSSSREVYGECAALPVAESAALAPCNVYGSSKAAAEMCCSSFRKAGLEVAVVRLSNVYGPGDQGRVIPLFVGQAVRGFPLTLFGAQQVMDFVWIDTVVDSLVRLGLGAYVEGPLNVGSGKGTTIVDLARRVVAEAESASLVEVVDQRQGEVMRFVADTAAAEREIGLAVPGDALFGLREVILAAKVGSEQDQNRIRIGSN